MLGAEKSEKEKNQNNLNIKIYHTTHITTLYILSLF